MTDFRIEVIIDPAKARAGARAVRGELDRTEDTASRLRGTLTRAFQIIGVGLIVRELGQMADAFTNAQNRLRTVTAGEEELTAVTKELFEIANRTRSSFEASATIYQRVATATKALGISQQETLQFTESLNKAVILSGATATEAQAGLIQLSQGIASGALRGQELLSILEQLPAVADVIAKSMGVTRGELRKLGEEGKITAEVILGAFAEARQELDERFEKSVKTLGQSFQVLKNSVLQYVGEANEAAGVSAFLAQGIILLSKNLDILVLGIFVLATAAIPAAIVAMKTLIAQSTILQATLAGGIFAPVILGAALWGAAVLLITDRLVKYQDEMNKAIEAGNKFALTDFGKVGADILRVRDNLERVEAAMAASGEATETQTKLAERYRQQLAALGVQQGFLRSGTARTTVQAQEQQKALEALAKSVAEVVAEIEVENGLLALNSREREIQAALLKEIDKLNKGTGPDVDADQRAAIELSLRGNQVLLDRASVLELIRGPQEKFQADLQALDDLMTAGTISAEEYNKGLAKLVSSAEGVDLSKVGVSGSAETLSRIQAQLAATKELVRQESIRDQVLRDANGPQQDLIDTQTVLRTLLDENTINQGQYNVALEAAKEKVRLLNPEYAAQRDLLKELQAPLLDLETRLKSLTVLYVTGEIGLAKYALETAKAQEAIRLLNPEYAAQKELLNEILGPAKAIEEQQRRLTELWLRGALSTSEYAAALEKTRAAMVALNPEQAAHKALLQEIHGPAKELADRQRRLTEELLVGGITLSEYATQMGKVKAALTAMNPEQQLQADILESIDAPQKQLLATQQALGVLFDQSKISAEAYTLAMNNAAIAANVLGSSVSTGLAAGLAQIENQLLDVGGTVQETLVNGFNAGQDALVDFVRTGTADFQQFVDVILDGLAKLLVQQALLALFPGGGAVGSFFAGAFGGGRAGGGDVRPGQAYVVGEKGPELFTPANPGNIVPAGETAAMLSGNMAPTINITAPPAQVNVINVRDPSEIPRGIQSAEGKQAVLNVIHEKRQTIRGAIG